MGKAFDQFEDLRDDGIRYARLKWASLRLAAADKISTSLSKTFGYVLFVFLLLFALAFLMVALALWIGEMLGHLSLGFLIAGGGLILLGVIAFFVGRMLVADSLVRHLIGVFFNDNDYYDGTQD